jgi:Xrn1 helical domain
MVLQEKYYVDKLEIKRGDGAGRRRVVDAFVEGLHWVLEYYYRCATAAIMQMTVRVACCDNSVYKHWLQSTTEIYKAQPL